MLIDVSIKNLFFFKDKQSLSMISCKDVDKYKDSIIRTNINDLELLPVSLIYGGSTQILGLFIEIIKYVKNLIIYGDEYFSQSLFYKNDNNLPSEISLRFLVKDKIYEFSFSFECGKIKTESLIEIFNNGNSSVLYEREDDRIINHIDYITKFDCRRNVLFLTSLIKSNLLKDIYEWFSQLYVNNFNLIYSDNIDMEKISHKVNETMYNFGLSFGEEFSSIFITRDIPVNNTINELLEILYVYEELGRDVIIINNLLFDHIHTNIGAELIKFITNGFSNRVQLITSTNNVLFMDLPFIRIDEINFIDYIGNRASICNLSEWETFKEKIQDLYLHGYFGGIPIIMQEKINDIYNK